MQLTSFCRGSDGCERNAVLCLSSYAFFAFLFFLTQLTFFKRAK